MRKEEEKWQKVLWVVFGFLLCEGAVGVSAWFRCSSLREMLILLMVLTAAYLGVMFALVQADAYGLLHYDNGGHYVRFVLTLILGTAAGCLFPMLSDGCWVFPAIALALTLFSNTAVGLTAYAVIVGSCVYFAGSSVLIFLMYFLVGCIYAVLFEHLDQEYKTGAPLSAATLLYLTVMLARVVLGSYGAVELESFMLPLLNLCVNFLFVLAVLRFYCAVAIDQEKSRYLTINDQEFELLARYKEENPGLYYNAIHTAYFAEKAARQFGMNVDLAKNGGYYHKLIAAECKKQDKSLEEFGRVYRFPDEAVRLLAELNYKSQPIEMKETAVVYLADCVVTSLLYLLDKDENAEIDFAKIAVGIIRRKVDSGILNKSAISLAQLRGMENIFMGEKLYYDFLRRK